MSERKEKSGKILSRLRNWHRLARSLIPAGVYLLADILWAVIRGEQIYAERIVVVFFAGWFLALILSALATHLPWSAAARIFVLWFFLFITRGINILLEWHFFSTESLATIFASGVATTIVSLAVAVVVVLLFPPGRYEGSLGGSVRSLLARRSWFSWIWRVATGVVAYVVVYFFFGAIAFQFTQPYYTNPAYGLNLTIPAPGLVFKLQFVRGFTYLLACFFVLSGLKLSRLRQGWLLGLALFIVGGLSPLLSAGEFPVALRVYHTVEIFFQNFSTGMVLALLLGVAPSAGPLPASEIPA